MQKVISIITVLDRRATTKPRAAYLVDHIQNSILITFIIESSESVQNAVPLLHRRPGLLRPPRLAGRRSASGK